MPNLYTRPGQVSTKWSQANSFMFTKPASIVNCRLIHCADLVSSFSQAVVRIRNIHFLVSSFPIKATMINHFTRNSRDTWKYFTQIHKSAQDTLMLCQLSPVYGAFGTNFSSCELSFTVSGTRFLWDENGWSRHRAQTCKRKEISAASKERMCQL